MTTLPTPAACDRIIGRLATSVGDARFHRFFDPSARLCPCADGLSVKVPTAFYADWLDRQFGQALREAATAELGEPIPSLSWTVDPSAFPGAADEAISATGTNGDGPASELPRTTDKGKQKPAPRPPITLKRLDEYIVGASNRLAYTAALRLADPAHDRSAFGLLFVHGNCGVGKTHLLQGIASRLLHSKPGAKVRYVTGEQFANEFIASVQSGGLEPFRKRYRGLDLLCLDDVHFLAGKTATQNEFLHTFDALDLGGARVAIASDQHPRQHERLNSQIISRFVSGMVVQIDDPDAALRFELAKRMAARRGLDLDIDTLRLVADGSGTSVRDIEGAITRLEAMVRLTRDSGQAAPPMAAVLSQVLGAGAVRKPVRLKTIVAVICAHLGVTESDLMGSGRHRRVVLARSVSAYLAREMTTHSYPEIARALGRDNHSTVVTAFQRIKASIAVGERCGCGPDMDGPIAELCEHLRAKIARQTA